MAIGCTLGSESRLRPKEVVRAVSIVGEYAGLRPGSPVMSPT